MKVHPGIVLRLAGQKDAGTAAQPIYRTGLIWKIVNFGGKVLEQGTELLYYWMVHIWCDVLYK
jgi:hypothetical protein